MPWYNIQVVSTRPIGQAVKTLASHAGNSGSIPGWVTNNKGSQHIVLTAFVIANSSPNLNPLAPQSGAIRFAPLFTLT